jgi:cytidylate kinase
MENRGMSVGDARRYMVDLDKGRREFVERFFHRDIADPHQYDLVINVDRLGNTGAIPEILCALGQ